MGAALNYLHYSNKGTIMKKLLACGLAAIALAGVIPVAMAAPVTYTLVGTASGKLGALPFTNAGITLTLRTDTNSVDTSKVAADGVTGVPSHPLYKATKGVATVNLLVNGKNIFAEFRAHEVYVSYDPFLGLVGFGSTAGGPGYPLVIGDYQGPNLPPGWVYPGTVSALADLANKSSTADQFSAAALALPANLKHSTLLTGATINCPGAPFALDPDISTFFCAAAQNDPTAPQPPAAPPLRTSRGDLVLDQQLPHENKGFFTVKVRGED
jgi:hypothetical protein